MKEDFVIQSDTKYIPLVEDRLFHFCHLCNIGNYASAVSVAVIQAVENAIKHGNKLDPAKSVFLTLGTCQGGVFAVVRDEGAGFDFAKYGQSPSDDRGNGIFVMRSLADSVSFADEGRCVRLEFSVAGIDPADALCRVSILRERFATVAA